MDYDNKEDFTELFGRPTENSLMTKIKKFTTTIKGSLMQLSMSKKHRCPYISIPVPHETENTFKYEYVLSTKYAAKVKEYHAFGIYNKQQYLYMVKKYETKILPIYKLWNKLIVEDIYTDNTLEKFKKFADEAIVKNLEKIGNSYDKCIEDLQDRYNNASDPITKIRYEELTKALSSGKYYDEEIPSLKKLIDNIETGKNDLKYCRNKIRHDYLEWDEEKFGSDLTKCANMHYKGQYEYGVYIICIATRYIKELIIKYPDCIHYYYGLQETQYTITTNTPINVILDLINSE